MNYDEAVAYIAGATSAEERLKRKSEVFHIIYGNNALRLAYENYPYAVSNKMVAAALTTIVNDPEPQGPIHHGLDSALMRRALEAALLTISENESVRSTPLEFNDHEIVVDRFGNDWYYYGNTDIWYGKEYLRNASFQHMNSQYGPVTKTGRTAYPIS